MLRFIQRQETDPYYNLAAEEHIFQSAAEDTFMTWRNNPAVIIGKHQNALKEINTDFVEKYQIPVIRRITGGGTVYHDPGNINFSFIFTQRRENLIDFREFTRPIILFLHSLGLDAAFEGKNNITVDGWKVSGNSAHLYKNKILYHGTLLFDTDHERLEKTIRGNERLFKDKSVGSIRSKTINIKEITKNEISMDQFISQFQKFIFNYFEGYSLHILNEEDRSSIKKLVDTKYKSYEWNFGYSPDYVFNNRFYFKDEEYAVSIQVKKGKIELADIKGPATNIITLNQLETLLSGLYHQKSSIRKAFDQIPVKTPSLTEFLNFLISKLF
ncbi:MAG TPA: lipoate--protein ligase [Bacteroidales bacterium]|nr:lipoate--protein ligase [Bacteroidales bacterium]HPI85497.1 lipoate--protein ligase [Bacteroidales bacterium]HPM92384.1 lipoate--protein ligase [Bacteroidales bacterium]